MDTNLRLIPEGNLSYNNIELCEQMIRKLYFNIPFIAELPQIDINDTTLLRTLSGFRNLKLNKNSLIFDDSSDAYIRTLELLNDAYNNMGQTSLEAFAINAPFMDSYLQILKEAHPKYTILKLTGIFSVMRMVGNVDTITVLSDKSYRKFFSMAITSKALWFIQKVKEISPNTVPIINFEEPLLYTFGNIKRNNAVISDDTIIMLFSKIFQRIKAEGGLICVQSFEKCNWLPVLAASPNMISFAAYNNPNNLSIIPGEINEFLAKGGHINWAIVPVDTERTIKSLTIDALEHKLIKTMEDLISCGVSSQLVYKHASVSLQGHLANIPLFFAEKAHILVKQLSGKIPTSAPPAPQAE